jgi:hypothetical protein
LYRYSRRTDYKEKDAESGREIEKFIKRDRERKKEQNAAF